MLSLRTSSLCLSLPEEKMVEIDFVLKILRFKVGPFRLKLILFFLLKKSDKTDVTILDTGA